MKISILSLVAFFFMLNLSLAQEKRSQAPRVMAKIKTGNYAQIPDVNYTYVNPNTTTKFYFTTSGTLSVSPNIRVLPNSNQQNEVILVSSPVNPLIMFGSANTTVGSTYGQGMYLTTNGGVTWFGSDILPNLPDSTSDPAPIIDKNGVLIFTTLNMISANIATLISNYSTNNGTTWSNYTTITSVNSDKNMIGTDDAPTSLYYGRTYSVWSNFALAQPPIMVSWTTNSGISWGTPIQIDNPISGHYSQGSDVIAGPQGNVYICWAAPLLLSPYTEDYAGFAKSTNGGLTWTVNQNIFDMNGISSSSFNGWGVRVNSFPRIGVDKSGGLRNGWIYIVTCDQNITPAGSDPDIVLHRSTDGGITWSAGIRVNQDAMNNGKVQFFPAINVDAYGGINIVYYDNRNYPSVGDSCETFVSRSIDGGNSWTDITVSDHRWKVKPESNFEPYMGDYIGITSSNNKVWPFWFDDKSGSMQAWTASIDLGPAITHTPLGNTETISGTRAVDAIITPAGSVIIPSLTKLYYSKNTTTFTDSLEMTNSVGNNWTGNITLSGAGTYRYYLKTVDSLIRISTSPGGAPGFYHTFIAAPDTIKPIITHSPLQNTPRSLWPVLVSATVTDNIGVDSVWVKWYKNNPSTGLNRFNLNTTSGSLYSGLFNSDTNQVNYYDSIYYRIFARDNSSNHNLDSTSLHSFKLIALTTSCIGSGSVSVGYPFYTFYMDSRTDLLYLASEISSGGGSPGAIQKIAFNIINPAAQVMNGFQVKMQSFAGSSISGFTSTGWTTVYDGTYSIAGAGWQDITLQTPFTWNGTSNLLIEICFNNNTVGPNSTVYATPSTGTVAHNHLDLETGDGCVDITSPNSSYTARPNMCFVISINSVGINPVVTTVPAVFNLSQNYPNPFNPVTQIKFDIAKQGLTKLIIYDVLGREITTLVNEVKSPGSYIVDFDASSLASGIYFYRLTAEDFNAVKKMILIK